MHVTHTILTVLMDSIPGINPVAQIRAKWAHRDPYDATMSSKVKAEGHWCNEKSSLFAVACPLIRCIDKCGVAISYSLIKYLWMCCACDTFRIYSIK